MSRINDMKAVIEKYTALLPVGKNMTSEEASFRASEFLVATAVVGEWKHRFTGAKIELTSIQVAVFAEQTFKGASTKITENKLQAEASKEHIVAREDLERIENDISYLKTMLDIFQNGHLFYRQMAKGE